MPVIRTVHDQALEEALTELGLDARGVAAYKWWEVYWNVLRNVLRMLRGMCTYLQVGRMHISGTTWPILRFGVAQVGQIGCLEEYDRPLGGMLTCEFFVSVLRLYLLIL